MKEVRMLMGMPIEIEIVAENAGDALKTAFDYFNSVDRRFSTYKTDSEISRINSGEIATADASEEMQEVFALAEKTKKETDGYFDIRRPDGSLDPSGIVKGWAIKNAAENIRKVGHEHFCINAGGDIASSGKNSEGEEWRFGIRNPFAQEEIIKVVEPKGNGLATSGTYIRGDHIYNPHHPEQKLSDIVSVTVIGPDVLEADRFATAAFAMGKDGIAFIEKLPGFEAYVVDTNRIATMTSGFAQYVFS